MPLIMPSRSSCIRQFLTDWCGADADGLNVASVYNLIFNAAFLVEAGVGTATYPKTVPFASGRSEGQCR